ncbi:AAEL002441-PA [Aedes aegypti]|uniref:AAEL002441-PA n=1 Tax=Aedes aegypti TaxID=7159 RepID=Q17I63_AEDAE|nr:AAEL002441-PA [Aedes aegypti]
MLRELLIAIVIVTIGVLAVSGIPKSKKNDSLPTVVHEYNDIESDEINWGYRLSDGREVDQTILTTILDDGREALEIDGSYTYFGPDGIEYGVEYTADENGYRPTIITPPLVTATHMSHINGHPTTGFPTVYPSPVPTYTFLPETTTTTGISNECLLSLVGCGK